HSCGTRLGAGHPGRASVVMRAWALAKTPPLGTPSSRVSLRRLCRPVAVEFGLAVFSRRPYQPPQHKGEAMTEDDEMREPAEQAEACGPMRATVPAYSLRH